MKSALSVIHMKSTKFQQKSDGFHEIHRISQEFLKPTAFHRMSLNSIAFHYGFHCGFYLLISLWIHYWFHWNRIHSEIHNKILLISMNSYWISWNPVFFMKSTWFHEIHKWNLPDFMKSTRFYEICKWNLLDFMKSTWFYEISKRNLVDFMKSANGILGWSSHCTLWKTRRKWRISLESSDFKGFRWILHDSPDFMNDRPLTRNDSPMFYFFILLGYFMKENGGWHKQ